MDLRLPGREDPRRRRLLRWIEEHPHPTPAQLADAGLVAPHWPPPWGLGADPVHQLIIDEELGRAGITLPPNPIGIGWAGPTILQAGTDEQRNRYLAPLLRGEEIWCQLFSEPDAGSDLASLRTRAWADGEEWVVQGRKVWTSLGMAAGFGILLARTDPEAPKHRGISYFICPMGLPGIEVLPIRDMTGGAPFSEVVLDGVRLPAGSLVGAVNDGWRLARTTLGNERLSLSAGGALWGMGPTTFDLIRLVRESPKALDAVERDRLARLFAESEAVRMLGLRLAGRAAVGADPGPEAAVRKILADEHGQHLTGLAKDLAGPGAMTEVAGPLGAAVGEWHWGFLFSRALTIGGGTGEVLRSLVAERWLGLPREPGLTPPAASPLPSGP
ncbi:MAG TPA: acyl-CoA dehydrogenase family protein [Gemmatimonadales bacterium]|nr:acyl-CoA dehydrogenase family protein [Gemmatimonadales bacterium]